LLEECLDDELGDDGSGFFIDCTEESFDGIVDYCKSNSIALCLHWDAKWEQESYVEYWVGGTYKAFFASGDGDVAVRLSQLLEHPSEMTIAEFVAKLEVPDFPLFEIVENDFCTDHLKEDMLKVAQVVLSVLGDNPNGGGCRAFWTPEEWTARNEEYGTDSILVLVHDGGDLAPACNWDYGNYELSDKLTTALNEAGFYYEQCTSWYSAVYRLPVAVV
jgi:hypothetical protein